MMNIKGGLNNDRRNCSMHGLQKEYYCVTRDCMTELCNNCFLFHNEMHRERGTESQLERIDNVMRMAREKIDRMKTGYYHEIKRLDKAKNMREQDWVGMIDEVRLNISKIKKVVNGAIDLYFEEMENTLKTQYILPAMKTSLNSLEMPASTLKYKIDKLNVISESITKGDNPSEMIKYVLNKLDSAYLERIRTKTDQIIQRDVALIPDASKVELSLDQNNLNNLYAALQNYVNVNVNLKDLLNDTDKNAPYDDFNSALDIQNTSVQQKNNSKTASTLLSNKKQRTIDFNLQVPEFFDVDAEKKLLHFFEPKTNNMHFVDLEKHMKNILRNVESHKNNVLHQSSSPLDFNVMELQDDLLIPRHHKSIITPEGYIILTGGLEQSKNGSITFLPNSYILDYENQKLVELAPMICPRAGHGIIYTPNGIMAVGGITKNQTITETCEIYNVDENKWYQIASLREPTMNSALCLFNGIYVIKISGKVSECELCQYVELYNFEENMWTILECEDPNFVIPSSCGCIQINESEILIFGGSFEQYSDRTDAIMVMQLDEELKTFRIKTSNLTLPVKESFINDQAISVNGRILALQNVPNPNEGKLFVHYKNIVCIGKEGCLILN